MKVLLIVEPHPRPMQTWEREVAWFDSVADACAALQTKPEAEIMQAVIMPVDRLQPEDVQ